MNSPKNVAYGLLACAVVFFALAFYYGRQAAGATADRQAFDRAAVCHGFQHTGCRLRQAAVITHFEDNLCSGKCTLGDTYIVDVRYVDGTRASVSFYNQAGRDGSGKPGPGFTPGSHIETLSWNGNIYSIVSRDGWVIMGDTPDDQASSDSDWARYGPLVGAGFAVAGVGTLIANRRKK